MPGVFFSFFFVLIIELHPDLALNYNDTFPQYTKQHIRRHLRSKKVGSGVDFSNFYSMSSLFLHHNRTSGSLHTYEGDAEYTHRPYGPSSFNNNNRPSDNRLSKSNNGLERFLFSLHLIADYPFFTNIGQGDKVLTTNIMTNLINRANNIFGDNFNQTIQFIVDGITILRDSDSNLKMADTAISVEDFLFKIMPLSISSFPSVGTKVIFTSRDFGNIIGATLTNAFIDDSSKTESGVMGNGCALQPVISTLMLTFISSQKRLNTNQQMLSLVHELGHSLGETHDDSQECASYSEGGHFIMNPTLDLSLSDKIDSYRFSKCSVKNIISNVKRGQTGIQREKDNISKDQSGRMRHVEMSLKCGHVNDSILNKGTLQFIKVKAEATYWDSLLIRLQDPEVYLPIIFTIVFLVFMVLVICSLRTGYGADDTNEMKATRHSRMLMAFAVGEHMTRVYRQKMVNVNKYYCKALHQVSQNVWLDSTTAIARLQTLFPHAPLPYLERVVKLSANENVAVKILLTHGYPMKTFYESMTSLKKIMKTVTIRYKNKQ